MDAVVEPTTIATQAKKTASFISLLEDTTAKSTSQTAVSFFFYKIFLSLKTKD